MVPLDANAPAVSRNPAVQEVGLEDEEAGDSLRRTRKESEWALRPLKIKFRQKDLERLYKNFIYRQEQTLLLYACVLMIIMALAVLLTFLAEEKVCLLSS